MEKINVGDVVCLKSDCDTVYANAMTVESVNDSNVICVWFQDKTLHRDSFIIHTLIRIR